MRPFPRNSALTLPERHLIDSLEFAKQSLEIHDKIRASNLPGLEDVMFSGHGELEFRVVGGRVGRDRLGLRLEVKGSLGVQCQRCLEEMDYTVDIARTFTLVADESALPEEEFEDDEVDYLVADPKLDVEALVEEEVLLSLPLTLRHENGCAEVGVSVSVGKPNPFQVLEGLKKK
jgi:uncharacterized protein